MIESARAKVAALAGARAEDVIFTSGGSEANALALAAQAGEAWHCYISAVEHPSVLAGGRFYRESTTRIPVSGDGVIDLDVLAAELAKHHLGGWRPFVSLMAANNETGAIQPVAEAAEIVHAAGGLLHTDAVQVAGRLPLDFGALGADMMTLSAHKIGGPKGVGAPGAPRRCCGRALDQGRRPGAAPPGRHRECRRHCGLRRGGGTRCGGTGQGVGARRAPRRTGEEGAGN